MHPETSAGWHPAALLSGWVACAAMGTPLDDLIDDFLAAEWEHTPVRASMLGIDGYHDRLGQFTADAFAQRERSDAEFLDRFRALADDGLSLDERIDRDLVIATLRGRQVMAGWEGWRRDPSTYAGVGLSGVFTLFLHRLLPDRELAEAAAARLDQVADVLAAGRDNLDASLAHPLIVERAIGQCAGGARYARDIVPAEVDDEGARALLADAGKRAAEAYEGFAEHLRDLASRATGAYAIGDERYSALLEEKELLGYGAHEMRERGRAAYAELEEEAKELAQQIGGTDDWQSVVVGLNQDHPATPEAMRAEYERVTEQARQFLHDTGLVTMPAGEVCHVVPSPPFQRAMLAVASYNSPPAFKASLTGYFFVPFPPDGVSDEEVQKRLETNSFHSIPTIAVHEAYPGHHWHLVTAQANPRPIRRVLSTSYFSEGWALYAERVMREHGFFTDPRHELCHLDARLFRAARIIVDTSLHIGDMTVEEAVAFMSTKASLSEPTARAEVGRYCSWPTQAASYLTGAIEIERIRDRWVAEGRALREFHDTIAGSGMLPIALAERSVFAA